MNQDGYFNGQYRQIFIELDMTDLERRTIDMTTLESLQQEIYATADTVTALEYTPKYAGSVKEDLSDITFVIDFENDEPQRPSSALITAVAVFAIAVAFFVWKRNRIPAYGVLP